MDENISSAEYHLILIYSYSCYNLLNSQVEELSSQGSACVYYEIVPINKEQCINVNDEYIHIPLYLEHAKVKNESILTEQIKTDDGLRILSFRIKNSFNKERYTKRVSSALHVNHISNV